jgi:quinol monooxygenase YgiN
MNSSTIVNVLAVFHPLEGHRDAVVAAMQVAIPRVHDEEGCEMYAITEAADGRLVMIEKWSSQALLDAHGTSPAVHQLLADLDGHLVAPAEVTVLVPLPMGDALKGAL